VGQYQNGKTNLDFTEARDTEHSGISRDICKTTSLQADNHASTPLLSFLQAGCPSCRPTNSVKALEALEISEESGFIFRENLAGRVESSELEI